MDHLLKNVIQGGLGKVERASASRSRTSNPLLFGVVDQTEVRRASTLGLGGRRRDNEVRLDRVSLRKRPRAPRRMDLPHQLPPFGLHGTALLVAPVPVDDPFDHGPRSFHGDEDGVPHVGGRLRGDPVGEHGRIGILRHPPDDQKHRRVRVSPLAPLSHPILILRPPGGGRWRFKPVARGKSICQYGPFGLTNVGLSVKRSLSSRDDDAFARDPDSIAGPPLPQIFSRSREDLPLDVGVLLSNRMPEGSAFDERLDVVVRVLERHRVGLSVLLRFVEARGLEELHHFAGTSEFVQIWKPNRLTAKSNDSSGKSIFSASIVRNSTDGMRRWDATRVASCTICSDRSIPTTFPSGPTILARLIAGSPGPVAMSRH